MLISLYKCQLYLVHLILLCKSPQGLYLTLLFAGQELPSLHETKNATVSYYTLLGGLILKFKGNLAILSVK